MKIPGDTGNPWRLHKYIDYHALGDADMNFPLLIQYADDFELDINQRFWLAFLYSTCYCVATTCYLFEELRLNSIEQFWKQNKPKLIFQTDRKYVKNMNWFVPIVKNYKLLVGNKADEYFFALRGSSEAETYNNLYKEIITWKYFGRFSTFLLIEAISKLTPLKADADWFDWKHGNTATSGMMCIMYKDREAEEFDDRGVLSEGLEARLNKALIKLKKAIKRKYPSASTNIVDIETSLCGFRKLFKGTRYGGYYIDRVQEEIQFMEKHCPEKQLLWNSLWDYRKKAFPHKFLGEIQGWKGIRKELNKQWIEKGLTGVEDVS